MSLALLFFLIRRIVNITLFLECTSRWLGADFFPVSTGKKGPVDGNGGEGPEEHPTAMVSADCPMPSEF